MPSRKCQTFSHLCLGGEEAVLSGWGQELRAGNRLRETGGIVDSRDVELPCYMSVWCDV